MNNDIKTVVARIMLQPPCQSLTQNNMIRSPLDLATFSVAVPPPPPPPPPTRGVTHSIARAPKTPLFVIPGSDMVLLPLLCPCQVYLYYLNFKANFPY